MANDEEGGGDEAGWGRGNSSVRSKLAKLEFVQFKKIINEDLKYEENSFRE